MLDGSYSSNPNYYYNGEYHGKNEYDWSISDLDDTFTTEKINFPKVTDYKKYIVTLVFKS